MNEDEQRAITLDLMRSCGYTIDASLRFIDGYEFYRDRLSWSDYRRCIKEHAVDFPPGCDEHPAPWPNRTAQEILAGRRPMTVDQFCEYRAAVYAKARR